MSNGKMISMCNTYYAVVHTILLHGTSTVGRQVVNAQSSGIICKYSLKKLWTSFTNPLSFSNKFLYSSNSKTYGNRCYNQGRRPLVDTFSSNVIGSIEKANYAIFSTNCAISWDTPAQLLRGRPAKDEQTK